jgi:hypothetical protein
MTWQPQSVIITTASQTIIVGETITYIWEHLDRGGQFLELTMLKHIRIAENFNRPEIDRWDKKTVFINQANIATIWPFGEFETQKEGV